MGLLFGPLAIPFALLAKAEAPRIDTGWSATNGSDAKRRSEVPAPDFRIRLFRDSCIAFVQPPL